MASIQATHCYRDRVRVSQAHALSLADLDAPAERYCLLVHLTGYAADACVPERAFISAEHRLRSYGVEVGAAQGFSKTSAESDITRCEMKTKKVCGGGHSKQA